MSVTKLANDYAKSVEVKLTSVCAFECATMPDGIEGAYRATGVKDGKFVTAIVPMTVLRVAGLQGLEVNDTVRIVISEHDKQHGHYVAHRALA